MQKGGGGFPPTFLEFFSFGENNWGGGAYGTKRALLWLHNLVYQSVNKTHVRTENELKLKKKKKSPPMISWITPIVLQYCKIKFTQQTWINFSRDYGADIYISTCWNTITGHINVAQNDKISWFLIKLMKWGGGLNIFFFFC